MRVLNRVPGFKDCGHGWIAASGLMPEIFLMKILRRPAPGGTLLAIHDDQRFPDEERLAEVAGRYELSSAPPAIRTWTRIVDLGFYPERTPVSVVS